MRLLSSLGASALLLSLAACPNPVPEGSPDTGSAGAADTGQACASPCGAACCSANQVCDPQTSTCTCKPSCDRRSCGGDGCGGKCGTCPTGTLCKETEGTCYACLPQCDGKTCGADGCGGQCGTCDPGEVCTDGNCAVCQPDCNRRSCGSDKCGGSCGSCGTGTKCDETAGSCVACAPQCGGKACGDDGCGGTCGTCGGAGETCTSAGQCISCTPQCANKECGDNACQGTCGTCDSGKTCDATGHCVGCTPSCSNKQCGADGCGGSCGSCTGTQTCTSAGQCQACIPSCGGKQCGEDGCGGSCGSCTGTQTCSATGQCQACTPACSGKQCGDNGCGGTCGTCTGSQTCSAAGQCQACQPSCSGKQCGDNGCGGSCGTCSGCNVCSAAGLCQACVPSCVGKQCGDNGCGGLCGVCSAGTCTAGKCVVCSPNQKRCSANGLALETCSADGTAWAGSNCPAPGRCESSSQACVATSCTPGARKCKDGFFVQECKADGSGFADRDCRTLDSFATADAKCESDDCLDPCGAAARSGSSQGCEFWASVTSNVQLDGAFRGNVADGTQGDAVSDFALVFANPNPAQAAVHITRLKGGVEQAAPSSPSADGYGAVYVPASGTLTVFLPWQAVSQTGQQPFGYHVTSSLPVAAYQFNPLDAYTNGAKQLDANGACTNCSYTSDASMLVPARSLTGAYVIAGLEHQSITAEQGAACSSDADCPGAGNSCQFFTFTCALGATYQVPAFFSVVAAENGTKVTIRFAASTKASLSGTSIAAQAAGSTASYTLNRYDVLQFWTEAGTATPTCSTYAAGSGWSKVCRHASDLTGTVITAADAADATKAKPVGVFSGADCSFVPYEQFACDHLEEMALPVAVWGKTYVGAHSPAYCTNTTAGACTAPVAAPAADHWRVVSGCAKENCPNGTRVVVDPAPPDAKVCGAATYVLPPIDVPGGKPLASWTEFTHPGDFLLTADQPVQVAQYLTGESANAGSVEGDPSLILMAPMEQWRTGYGLLASPTLVHNYVTLAAPEGISSITLDSKALNAGNFPGLSTANVGAAYTVYRVPVAGGAHTVSASAPVGATVTGYDAFISYGYLGGTDLKKINASMP